MAGDGAEDGGAGREVADSAIGGSMEVCAAAAAGAEAAFRARPSSRDIRKACVII